VKRLRIEDQEGQQRIIWSEIMRSRESRYNHRLHGVLAVCRGLSCYETAAIWGRSPRAVEYWVRRFSKEGVGGLQEKKRPGRPSKLNDQQLEMLRRDLEKGPGSVGQEEDRWTGPLLQSHLAEYYGVDVGVRQCQRMIRENPAS